MCFQDVDHAKIKPVRYAKLNHSISGLCVSGSSLVVTDCVNTSPTTNPHLNGWEFKTGLMYELLDQ